MRPIIFNLFLVWLWTETPLVALEDALVDDLHWETDRGNVTLVILLNLSMFFSTINHGIILDYLSGLWLEETILCYFSSYLETKFQKVKSGIWPVESLKALSCCQQASILSPISSKWNHWVKSSKDMGWAVTNIQMTFSFILLPADPRETIETLNWHLETFLERIWAIKLKLTLLTNLGYFMCTKVGNKFCEMKWNKLKKKRNLPQVQESCFSKMWHWQA